MKSYKYFSYSESECAYLVLVQDVSLKRKEFGCMWNPELAFALVKGID
jgi:hypothetical protein